MQKLDRSKARHIPSDTNGKAPSQASPFSTKGRSFNSRVVHTTAGPEPSVASTTVALAWHGHFSRVTADSVAHLGFCHLRHCSILKFSPCAFACALSRQSAADVASQGVNRDRFRLLVRPNPSARPCSGHASRSRAQPVSNSLRRYRSETGAAKIELPLSETAPRLDRPP
ncbi:MAG: hypothetical protein JWR21_1869 [Herminiimonas sp.]|nr:hypothetical protein [Herminiimonas sp.]